MRLVLVLNMLSSLNKDIIIIIIIIMTSNKSKTRMQRPGTEAIRTKIEPSRPKREITKIANSQNTKRTYGQPSEQLFPK